MKICLLLVSLLSSANVFSASYKWVDENNQTHYTEQPPPNKTAKLLPSSRSSSDATGNTQPPASKTIAERAAELDKEKLAKKEVADKTAQKQAYADALKANCDSAKKNLADLQTDIRLIEINANGERSFLSDEQRQEKIAKAQQNIQDSCK